LSLTNYVKYSKLIFCSLDHEKETNEKLKKINEIKLQSKALIEASRKRKENMFTITKEQQQVRQSIMLKKFENSLAKNFILDELKKAREETDRQTEYFEILLKNKENARLKAENEAREVYSVYFLI